MGYISALVERSVEYPEHFAFHHTLPVVVVAGKAYSDDNIVRRPRRVYVLFDQPVPFCAVLDQVEILPGDIVRARPVGRA